MRYTNLLNHPDHKDPKGYTGTTMGSGRNSGDQEQESWKDADKPTDITASDEAKSDAKDDSANATRQGTPNVTRGDKNAHGQTGVVKIRK